MDKKFFEVLLHCIGIVVCVLLAVICNIQAEHFSEHKPNQAFVFKLLYFTFGAVAFAITCRSINSIDKDEDDLQ